MEEYYIAFEDGSWCIAVKWDSCSTLSLIQGVDRYKIMDHEKSKNTWIGSGVAATLDEYFSIFYNTRGEPNSL